MDSISDFEHPIYCWGKRKESNKKVLYDVRLSYFISAFLGRGAAHAPTIGLSMCVGGRGGVNSLSLEKPPYNILASYET